MIHYWHFADCTSASRRGICGAKNVDSSTFRNKITCQLCKDKLENGPLPEPIAAREHNWYRQLPVHAWRPGSLAAECGRFYQGEWQASLDPVNCLRCLEILGVVDRQPIKVGDKLRNTKGEVGECIGIEGHLQIRIRWQCGRVEKMIRGVIRRVKPN